MQLKYMVGLAVSAIVAFLPFASEAQVKISELQRSRNTSLVGTVTGVFGDNFVLDDGTGQILVEAEARWLQQANLAKGEKVTVVGEYDDDDFDAFRITRSNGQVIQVYDD